MTKLTPEFVGRICQYREMTHCTINQAAAHFRIDWHTCHTAVNHAASPHAQRRPRKSPSRVAKRRALVKALAINVARKAHHEYAVFPSAAAIREELQKRSTRVSKCAVLRDLHFCGFSSRVRKWVPVRDSQTHAQRLKFACALLRHSDSWLRSIVFTDEHTCSCNDYSHRRQWVRVGDRLLTRERKRVHNVPHVMIWAAVGVGYKGPLILFPQSASKSDDVEGAKAWRMNSCAYVKRCLSKVAADLVRGHRILQQDGARPHTAARTTDYLKSKHIEVLKWPPYSPDLNCIEQLWPLLNKRIGAMHPITQHELVECIKVAWGSITQAEVDAYCVSFKTKLQKCRRKNGEC